MHKPILFLDMDQVLADFSRSPVFEEIEKPEYNPPEMYQKYFFEELPVVDGALSAVRRLMRHYEIHILTQPVSETHYSYSEKAAWIWKWFPELGQRVHMSQNKEFLSAPGRVLVDDNKGKWCDLWESKGGTFIHFEYSPDNRAWNKQEWNSVVGRLLDGHV